MRPIFDIHELVYLILSPSELLSLLALQDLELEVGQRQLWVKCSSAFGPDLCGTDHHRLFEIGGELLPVDARECDPRRHVAVSYVIPW
jgi:hypothetical protein